MSDEYPPQLTAAGAPHALFTGLTIDAYRVSDSGKLHERDSCFHVKSWRSLRRVAVPLLSLNADRCCVCFRRSDLPADVRRLLDAAADLVAAFTAAQRTSADCLVGHRPALADVAALRQAAATGLTRQRDALLAVTTGAAAATAATAERWHTAVTVQVDRALRAHADAFGGDTGREVRAAAALLTASFGDRVDTARHPALGWGYRGQEDVLESATGALRAGLTEGRDRAQLRVEVLAVVDGAVPRSLAQVPDVAPRPGLGAREAALTAWRAAARDELAEMLTAALADFDRLAADTDETLLVLGGEPRDEQARGLLAGAIRLGERGSVVAYAAPAVVGRAIVARIGVLVPVAGVPLPPPAERGDVVTTLLQLLVEGDLDTDDALAVALGVAARPAA